MDFMAINFFCLVGFKCDWIYIAPLPTLKCITLQTESRFKYRTTYFWYRNAQRCSSRNEKRLFFPPIVVILFLFGYFPCSKNPSEATSMQPEEHTQHWLQKFVYLQYPHPISALETCFAYELLKIWKHEQVHTNQVVTEETSKGKPLWILSGQE